MARMRKTKKSKPRRTTIKKSKRPTVTKTVPYVGPKDDDRPSYVAPTGTSRPGFTKETSKSVAQKDFAKKYPRFPPLDPSANLYGMKPRSQVESERIQAELDAMINRSGSRGIVDIGGGEGQIDRGLAAAVGTSGLTQGDPWVSTSGWKPDIGIGGETPEDGTLPPEDVTLPPEDKEKKEDDADKKAKDKAKWLTDWWAKYGTGYRKYGDRKSLLSGDTRNTQAKVTEKIQEKLNKGYYKIVDGPINPKTGKPTPLIIHASTGIPVNPFTGHIVDTQSQGAQGGGYQNDMASALGIDKEHAGVFSTEYQRGNGLSVSEMKPQHALRFLMKKNSKAFEEFFQMNKTKKGFNPFSVSAISSAMGSVLNMITGPEALQVGNNLERAGWGKAIENKDGSYSVKLTEKGAQGWSDSFNVAGYVSPAAISKDKDKGWLSDLLGTRKFPDQPIDLTNLIGDDISKGGYFQGSELVPGQTGQPFDPNTFDPMNPQGSNLATLDPNLTPNVPFQDVRGWMPPIKALGSESPLPGTPPSQYPQFTPEGYNIGAYNPSRDYSGGTGQARTGDGGGGGGGGGNGDDTTTQGPLTFDVHGRPITYDYTGGPEQIQLAGGWRRDGKYIGSPWGFKDGGIANFRPYGY